MRDGSKWIKDSALGAAGGFAGTLALQALMTASQKWLPSTVPPLRKDPGEALVEKVQAVLPEQASQQIPDGVAKGAARTLAVGYGLTFGALYGAVRPDGGRPLLDGFVLGIGCWAAGYLGWLPALGLMPPVWRHQAPQAIAPVAEHVIYGIATVATYNWLRGRFQVAHGR